MDPVAIVDVALVVEIVAVVVGPDFVEGVAVADLVGRQVCLVEQVLLDCCYLELNWVVFALELLVHLVQHCDLACYRKGH